MTDYRPILFFSQLSADCLRVRRAIRELGIDVDMRSILLSRRHREDLREVTGNLNVPCLVISRSTIQDVEDIEKYLELRYRQ